MRATQPLGPTSSPLLLKAILGSAAAVAWLLIFAAGLLVDSRPYRNGIQPTIASTLPARGASTQPADTDTKGRGLDLRAFAVTVCVYTPTSVAFLALLAAFIGGCASNLTFSPSEASRESSEPADERAQQRMLFLTENPLASMLRGFLVYLGFIAGVYITADAPFANPTASQFVRFAGTMSLVAFAVGYDPLKFQDLLTVLPRIGGTQTQGARAGGSPAAQRSPST